ncbi:MAG: pantoate--beta-alanine ligase [Oscillospiraceae bacterium]|nr:pantoate--beta-alanine ligase [Oscillospiraceae bacterium]
MKLVTSIDELRKEVKEWKKSGLTVGLVPTMGFLHEGHKSLIHRAVAENDKVVVSNFVNPSQFGPNEDYESYPRDQKKDFELCENEGAAIMFAPTPEEMYCDPKAYVAINDLSEKLCGKTRPIHFKGVCTVVSKLFNIVTPDRAYFGQKDAQQLIIIKKMVKDLNFGIEIVGCPIIRESDGLAKSSRNTYLNDEERKAALCLSKSIKKAKELVAGGNDYAVSVVNEMKAVINAEKLAKIDYVEAVSEDTLEPVEKLSKGNLVAMAVYIGKTRLIDNFIVGE